MKTHLDPHRLTAFSTEIEPEEIARYLHAWKLVCQGGPDGGSIAQLDRPERFRWLTAARSTILQCSPVHPGICEDPARELADLFDEYVM